MNKINARVLFFIGLIILFGSPVIFVPIALLFPKMEGDNMTPVIIGIFFISAIMFVLALAKKRIQCGKVKAAGIYKALTPAQKFLILSLIVFEIEIIAQTVYDSIYNQYILFAGAVLLITAIVLAIIGVIKHIREFKRSVSEKLTLATARIDYCFGCKTADDESQLKIIGGHKYCTECVKILEAARNADTPDNKARCGICEKEFFKSDMVFVDDRYICQTCLSEHYGQ